MLFQELFFTSVHSIILFLASIIILQNFKVLLAADSQRLEKIRNNLLTLKER